jgi:GntR family transcriptional regulator
MLHFHINPHSGLPVYRQMIDQFKYYIASAALKPGEQLPSIRELAQTLAINPTTVVRVYTELERDGVIDMRHGKGAFVAAGARRMTPEERERALRPLARQLAVEASQVGAASREVLRLLNEELDELQEIEANEQPVRMTLVTKR